MGQYTDAGAPSRVPGLCAPMQGCASASSHVFPGSTWVGLDHPPQVFLGPSVCDLWGASLQGGAAWNPFQEGRSRGHWWPHRSSTPRTPGLLRSPC